MTPEDEQFMIEFEWLILFTCVFCTLFAMGATWERFDLMCDVISRYGKTVVVALIVCFIASLAVWPFSEMGKTGAKFFGTVLLLIASMIPVALFICWGIADRGEYYQYKQEKEAMASICG